MLKCWCLTSSLSSDDSLLSTNDVFSTIGEWSLSFWYHVISGMCFHQLICKLSKQTWPCIELEHGVDGVSSDYVWHNLNSSSLTVNDKTEYGYIAAFPPVKLSLLVSPTNTNQQIKYA